jgi:hypothetical protein
MHKTRLLAIFKPSPHCGASCSTGVFATSGPASERAARLGTSDIATFASVDAMVFTYMSLLDLIITALVVPLSFLMTEAV